MLLERSSTSGLLSLLRSALTTSSCAAEVDVDPFFELTQPIPKILPDSTQFIIDIQQLKKLFNNRHYKSHIIFKLPVLQ